MIEHLAMVHAIVLEMINLEQPSRAAQDADDEAEERCKSDSEDGCTPEKANPRPTTKNADVKLWVKTATERQDAIRNYSK